MVLLSVAGSVESYVYLHLSEGMNYNFYYIIHCIPLKEKICTSFSACKEQWRMNDMGSQHYGGRIKNGKAMKKKDDP